MKHLLTLFLVLFFSFISYGQQDYKWYVLNGELISNPSSLATPIYTNDPAFQRTCYIENVRHPFRDPGLSYPYDEAERNDLFIIFDDGSHFNSKDLDGLNWDDHNANGDEDYYLKTGSSITHLYWTNVYETDEEPEAMVTTAPPTIPISPYSFKHNSNSTINANEPIGPITSNHTPVPGTDMTLIFDHSHFDKSCTYDLCYTICGTSDHGNYPFSRSNIFPNNSFIASGGTSKGIPVSSPTLTTKSGNFSTSKQNCIEGIVFNQNEAYTYINLFLSEDPYSLIANCPIEFELISSDSSCNTIPALKDTIKNSHDPNYVEVLCVNQPLIEFSTTSTIKYRVQCMNDGTGEQDDPSIELTFPFYVTSDDIIITNSSIRSCLYQTVFNNQAPEITSPEPNRIMFQFCGTLEACPILTPERSECKAWVEFCVKVKTDSVDVLIDNIKPFDRNTNFGNDPYVIDRYIPLPCDSMLVPIDTTGGSFGNEGSSIETDSLSNKDDRLEPNEELVNLEWVCARENMVCDCAPNVSVCPPYVLICVGTINWTLLWGIILMILILLWFLRKRYKKRSKG